MSNSLIRGRCKDLSFEGKGVVSFKDGTIFVDGLFPNEEADIEILYKRNGVYFGKVRKLYNLSEDRQEPRCKICTACGGCQFLQYKYEAQLLYKTNKVKSAFKRHLHKEVDVLPCLGMEDPFFYRNKIQVPIGKDKKGHIVTGFYRNGTHEIIPTEKCFIEDEKAYQIIKSFKELVRDFYYEPYDEDKRTGLFRHILIRTSKHYDEVMVTLVTAFDEFKGKNNFIKEFIKKCPNITSIIQNINERKTNVILGEKERVLYGPSVIKDSILGVDFLISSKSFFQVNPTQVEVLYKKALDLAEISTKDVVFDAYCGIGTIGLIASKQAKKVIGVEIVKDAIKDANRNKQINNISNATFICGDAGEELEKLEQENIHFDVVFVDPPRKGLSEQFISSLLRVKPKKIVYVSCDPETLAMDINTISKEYQIKQIQPVDMFPQSFHCETITLLCLKKMIL